MNITFSEQQATEIKKITYWYKNDTHTEPYYYLAGFAGTGKTTLAKYIAQELNAKVAYAAYTGKAALVMQKNGCHGASTIHSLIYIPEVDPKTGVVTFKLNPESMIADCDLLIVDECSMVDTTMGNHVLSFGVPLLVLGDPAQLDPINGAGFFTSKQPNGMLTEIHRQARENPIIFLATRVRNGEYLKVGDYGGSKVTDKFRKAEVMKSDQFICGTNKTRTGMNAVFRDMLGYEDIYPLKGEKLICLKNDHEKGMLNGEIYTAIENAKDSIANDSINLKIKSQDRNSQSLEVKALRYHFDSELSEPDWKLKKGKNELTYGYALTCHKSQGSQWDNVYIYDESKVFGDMWWKWIYTAITRASENVIVRV